jgi:hypothetical protein
MQGKGGQLMVDLQRLNYLYVEKKMLYVNASLMASTKTNISNHDEKKCRQLALKDV